MNMNAHKQRQRTHLFHHASGKYPLGYLLPLIAILSIIPLIVNLYQYRTGFEQYCHIQAPDIAYDFFLHTKMICLYIAVLGICFMILYRTFCKKEALFWNPVLLPLFLYALLCLLSAFTSIQKDFSFFGSYDQFESVWILFGYPLILYYAAITITSKKAVLALIPFFNTGVALISLLGLLQAFGLDPYYFIPFQKLFVRDPQLIGKLIPSFKTGQVYLSLYNPNYVGFYVILILPILFSLFFHTGKSSAKTGYALLILSQCIILFASRSRAGFLVFCFLILMALLFFRTHLAKYKQPILILCIMTVLSFFVINLLNKNIILKRLSTMFRIEKTSYDLESIVTGKDVSITYKGSCIHFRMDAKSHFSLTDDDKKQISYTPATNDTPNLITDKRFPFSFGIAASDTFHGFFVKIPAASGTKTRTWFFTNQMKKNDASYYVRGENDTKLFHLTKKETGSSFLETHSALANMRGFIWARTLPLLKKYFLLGSGPDTFVLAFPNDDLVGLFNSGHDHQIITKPHCLYLQIAAQTGLPSLVAFLCFFLWYLTDSIRCCRMPEQYGLLPKLRIAIIFSITGYLLLGLTNDSCIAVSPIFYALAGIGLGLNRTLKHRTDTNT